LIQHNQEYEKDSIQLKVVQFVFDVSLLENIEYQDKKVHHEDID
jgi:hypothetical protein